MPELAAAKALDLGVVPTGPCLRAEHGLRFTILLSARSLHRLMYRESLFCRPVSVCRRSQTGKISTNFNQSLEFPILLGPDHHLKILLKLRI